MTESDIIKLLRLNASKGKHCLMRNNSGAVHTSDGRFIRFGIGNDSEKLNNKFKSSDLIGFKSIMITPDMVGKKVAIFCAREAKRSGWRYMGTSHEKAQKVFIDFINSVGGDAAFSSTGEFN